jgi:hypothetical protein
VSSLNRNESSPIRLNGSHWVLSVPLLVMAPHRCTSVVLNCKVGDPPSIEGDNGLTKASLRAAASKQVCEVRTATTKEELATAHERLG